MPLPRFVDRFGVLAVLTALCFIASASAEEHTFSLDTSDWNDSPRSVHVAGSFNGWSKDATPMRKTDDNTWAGRVDLAEGVYHYKFVIDGERWVNDPASDRELEVSDGHGGVNSAVYIGLDGRDLPPAEPNHIRKDAVGFEEQGGLIAVGDELLMVSVRTQADDVQTVEAKVGGIELPLARVASRMGFDHYEGIAPVSEELVLAGLRNRLPYRITLTDGDDRLELEGHTSLVEPIDTPDWARDAVWYQVFPERFRNGDKANDPGDRPWERLIPWNRDWWDTYEDLGETPGPHNFYQGTGNVWHRRYGGDFQGLTEALPYLRKLGVNAIYLNPVFEGDSMHKYDTADYRHIDDNFGVRPPAATQPDAVYPPRYQGETDDPKTWTWSDSDRVFLDFIREAHAQGFHVIIDGVFNHVGRAHYAFQDVLENGKRSVYANWFDITDWGDEANWGKPETYGKPGGIQWNAWDQPNGALPNFKKNGERGLADGPRQHIFDITRRWMDPNGDGDPSDGIDGWRLDVPQDIPQPFWRDWRKVVREVNPDAYISGEIWGWAQPWINDGDQFDAVMNYQFAMAAQDFFVDQADAISPSQFAVRLETLVKAYPFASAQVQQNLFDSHDTDRLASMFVNPDLPYDGANRPQDNGPRYNADEPSAEDWQRLRQAVAMQMVFVGAPMIYYGNEAGMFSPDDPSNRQPMTWPGMVFDDPRVKFRPEIFEWHQRLIAVRHALPALRRGLYATIATDDEDETLVFARQLDDQRVYVAINRSPAEKSVSFSVDDEGEWINALDARSTRVVFDDSAEGDKRPQVLRITDCPKFQPNGRRLDIRLAAFGTAVLVPIDSLEEK